MKHTWVLACVLVLVAGTALAAGQKESPAATADYGFRATGMPIVSQPITLKVLYPRQTIHGDFSQMWFMPHILELTGIDLQFDLVENAGWSERKALAFASGDLPDVFMYGVSRSDETTYGPQGLLTNLAPYIARHAPNAMRIYAKFPEIIKTIKFPDGAIYIMPSVNDSPREVVERPVYINKAWLTRLGLSKPTTLDELRAALKAIKERDPNGNGRADEIPVSSTHTRNFKNVILYAVGFVHSLHDVINGKYVYVPSQPGYREYLRFMNRLYSDGLLDSAYFSQSSAQLLAKQSGRLVGVMDESPYAVIPKYEEFMEYDSLGPLTSSVNKTPMAAARTAFERGWGVFAMTSRNRYPEAAVRLIDYFYTTEGSRAVRAGPEYGKWKGDGGYEIVKETDTEVEAVVHMPGFTSFWNWRLAKAGPTNLPFMSTPLVQGIIIGADRNNSQLTKWIFDSRFPEVRRFGYPEVTFTEAEQQRIVTFVDLDNYVSTMTAKFITGEVPVEGWEGYLAELKRLGVDEMASIRQAARDRYDKISPTIP